jgi:hypothetical protein
MEHVLFAQELYGVNAENYYLEHTEQSSKRKKFAGSAEHAAYDGLSL